MLVKYTEPQADVSVEHLQKNVVKINIVCVQAFKREMPEREYCSS